MTKRLTQEEKVNKAIVDIINQMFIIAGHDVTYDDVVGKENWFREYKMTLKQGEEWEQWGKQYLIKNLKMNSKEAEKEMNWFTLQYGLTYSDWD